MQTNIPLQKEENKATLPQLVKQSTTYKLYVPKKVEEKIRYLCRKFPTLEWSGILFYTHTGSFENNDLEIHCEDIYPMDLGTSTFTKFRNDETIAGYIADNIELFDCDMGLIHSHNTMPTFLSGTDTATLQSEGYDTNCFVSLIVNNEGTYCAAITRKIQLTTEVVTKSLGTSYEFFGEGKIKTDEDPMSEATRVLSKEVIEYFMLDVEREVVDNPFEFLDKRFEEIEAQKKSATTQASSWLLRPETLEEEDNNYSFYDWQKKHSKVTQPLLFSNEEMGIPEPQDWEPDPDTIHYMVCQMVTCSLIVNASIDLEQWISKHMEEKYCEIFENSNITQFDDWKEFIIEFLINGYCDATTPEELLEDYDMYQSKLASALYTELSKYEDNSYLTEYKETLKRFIYD